jgi:hypothetical protein
LQVSASGTYTVARTTSSFNGGILSITGNNISPSGFIKINGVRSNLFNVTTTDAKVQIPPLITTLTQSTFNIQ